MYFVIPHESDPKLALKSYWKLNLAVVYSSSSTKLLYTKPGE